MLIGSSVCNKIIVKSAFNCIRFPLDTINEDVYILPDLIKQCKNIAICDKTFYNYYSRPGSITGAPYSFKQVTCIDFTNHHIQFFADRNIKSEADCALIEYLGWYIPNHIAIYTEHKEFKKDFRPYFKQALKRIPKVITTKRMLSAKKWLVIYLSLFISTSISRKLYFKLCPRDLWRMCIYR